MNKKGKIIVIDGLDGSGKTTQAELVYNEIVKKHDKVKLISFPDYSNTSSTLVKMYLNGEISDKLTDINAYAASSFYATDRYISYKKYWEQDYLDGYFIIATRYVSSNAIHQMVKLDKALWKDYIDWLIDYEHNKLGLPKADKIIYLDMPRDIADFLIESRYQGDNTKKDIHEKDVNYLKSCTEAAYFAADKLGFSIITCGENNQVFKKEYLTQKILEAIFND